MHVSMQIQMYANDFKLESDMRLNAKSRSNIIQLNAHINWFLLFALYLVCNSNDKRYKCCRSAVRIVADLLKLNRKLLNWF